MKAMVVFLGVLVVLVGGPWSYCLIKKNLVLDRADQAIKKGFPAVAWRALEKYKDDLVDTKEHCNLLINATYGTRLALELDVAAQSCYQNGIVTVPVVLGLASAQEFRGNLNLAAQQILKNVKTLNGDPVLYLRLAQYFDQVKNINGAAQILYEAAVKKKDDAKFLFNVLLYLTKNKVWVSAHKIADMMRPLKITSPHALLSMARAIQHSGKIAEASDLVKQVKATMTKLNAKQIKGLKSVYSDVFKAEKTKKL